MSRLSVHPHDRLSHAKHRLTFLTTLLTLATSGEGGGINLAHPSNQDGLYFTLHGIADDIDSALDALMSEVPR